MTKPLGIAFVAIVAALVLLARLDAPKAPQPIAKASGECPIDEALTAFTSALQGLGDADRQAIAEIKQGARDFRRKTGSTDGC